MPRLGCGLLGKGEGALLHPRACCVPRGVARSALHCRNGLLRRAMHPLLPPASACPFGKQPGGQAAGSPWGVDKSWHAGRVAPRWQARAWPRRGAARAAPCAALCCAVLCSARRLPPASAACSQVWVNTGDIVLVGLRDYQDEKADVILKWG